MYNFGDPMFDPYGNFLGNYMGDYSPAPEPAPAPVSVASWGPGPSIPIAPAPAPTWGAPAANGALPGWEQYYGNTVSTPTPSPAPDWFAPAPQTNTAASFGPVAPAPAPASDWFAAPAPAPVASFGPVAPTPAPAPDASFGGLGGSSTITWNQPVASFGAAPAPYVPPFQKVNSLGAFGPEPDPAPVASFGAAPAPAPAIAPAPAPMDSGAAWGAGPSAPVTSTPTNYGTPNANGVLPGWESYYGNTVSTPAPSPVPSINAPAPDMNVASFGGAPVAPMAEPVASFGAAPAPAPIAPTPETPPMSIASFGPTAPAPAPVSAASFGPTGLGGAPASTMPDMGQFLRGLDWSPQNAANATRQMQAAMFQYGWTPDQVGANLGFTGQQINEHIARYASERANAPATAGASFGPTAAAPAAPDMGAFIRGLDWSPNNAFNATKQLKDAMGQYGWTSDQVGKNLGFTGQQMDNHFSKYSSPEGYIRSLDWSPQNAATSTQQLRQAMGQYGWTADQVGKPFGFSGADMIGHFNRYPAQGGGMGAGGATGGLGGGIIDSDMGMSQFLARQGGGMMQPGGSGSFNERGGFYQPGIANDPNGGGSVASNPYMGEQMRYLRQQMQDALGQNLQGIRSNYVANGGLGGSRQAIAESEALKNFDNSFGAAAANMLGSNYQFDRGLNTGSYNTNRSLDLQQAGLGMSAMQSGLGMQWLPLQNANAMYTPYTGLGSQSTPGTGGGWMGALGGALGGAQMARNFGWF